MSLSRRGQRLFLLPAFISVFFYKMCIRDSLSSDPQIGCDVLTAIGVYPLSPGETDINAAIDKANYAREQLPKGSRGKYIFYDDNLVNKLQFEKKLEREMAQALTDGDFKTYYQPKVDCFTGQVIGAEALVRWEHRELEMCIRDSNKNRCL